MKKSILCFILIMTFSLTSVAGNVFLREIEGVKLHVDMALPCKEIAKDVSDSLQEIENRKRAVVREIFIKKYYSEDDGKTFLEAKIIGLGNTIRIISEFEYAFDNESTLRMFRILIKNAILEF